MCKRLQDHADSGLFEKNIHSRFGPRSLNHSFAHFVTHTTFFLSLITSVSFQFRLKNRPNSPATRKNNTVSSRITLSWTSSEITNLSTSRAPSLVLMWPKVNCAQAFRSQRKTSPICTISARLRPGWEFTICISKERRDSRCRYPVIQIFCLHINAPKLKKFKLKYEYFIYIMLF